MKKPSKFFRYNLFNVLIVFGVFLGGFSIAVPQVFASSLIFQTDQSSYNTSLSGGALYNLGTGLSGVPTSALVEMFIKSYSPSGHDELEAFFRAYTDSAYTSSASSTYFCNIADSSNSAQSDWGTIPSGGVATSSLQFNFSGCGSLDPTLYYTLTFFKAGNYSAILRFFGSSSDIYTGSFTHYYSDSVSPLVDGNIILNGVSTVSDTSYISNLKPYQGSTTPTTSVLLSMDYHAVASQGIDTYSFFLNDISVDPYGFATSTINISGSASSGDHSVSRTISLTSGHLYAIQGYICNSLIATCYSGASQNKFSVVTNYNTIYDSYFTASGGMVATSSSDFYNSASIFPQIAHKIPFAYIYQIYTAWQSASATTTDNLVGVSLPLSQWNRGTTTAMGNILPDWGAFSKASILTYMSQGQLDVFKAIMSVVLYMSMILYIFRRVSNFIRS